MNSMLDYRTQGFKGYGVKYSPFFDSHIAVAASANYGLVGNGRLYVLGLTPQGIQGMHWWDTQDAQYDVAWSEANENQAVVGCGDGSIKLFDTKVAQFPVMSWQEHQREVFGVHWNLVSKDTFASSSWDGTVKVWSPERPHSIVTIPTHSCTYSVAWSPHSPSVFSCVSSDSHLRVYDIRTPASAAQHLVSITPIHAAGTPIGPQAVGNNRQSFAPSEALTHDWNKYRDGVIATAGVDRIIRTFDIRKPANGPLALLHGHQYAVRKLAWSPHVSDMLLSASYDMTCRVWTDANCNGVMEPKNGAMEMPRQIASMGRHTEFVTGVDWCLFGAEGWCASVGWDEMLYVWDARGMIGRS